MMSKLYVEVTSPDLGVRTRENRHYVSDVRCPIDNTPLILHDYGDAHHGVELRAECFACGAKYGELRETGRVDEMAREYALSKKRELELKRQDVAKLESILSAAVKNGMLEQ